MPPSSSSFPLASCIAICKSREQDLLLSFLVRRFFQRSIWLCLPESKGRNHFKSHPTIFLSFFSFIGPSRRRWPEKLNPSQWSPSIPDMIATWKWLETTISKWYKLQNMKETKTTWRNWINLTDGFWYSISFLQGAKFRNFDPERSRNMNFISHDKHLFVLLGRSSKHIWATERCEFWDLQCPVQVIPVVQDSGVKRINPA